ncbi:hypothetical protein LEP1GSC150_2114, partial [Leptospira interrogans serovar Copenhageni str. LT2050]
PALHLAKGVVAKGNITITGGQKKDVKKNRRRIFWRNQNLRQRKGRIKLSLSSIRKGQKAADILSI